VTCSHAYPRAWRLIRFIYICNHRQPKLTSRESAKRIYHRPIVWVGTWPLNESGIRSQANCCVHILNGRLETQYSFRWEVTSWLTRRTYEWQVTHFAFSRDASLGCLCCNFTESLPARFASAIKITKTKKELWLDDCVNWSWLAIEIRSNKINDPVSSALYCCSAGLTIISLFCPQNIPSLGVIT